MKKLLTLFFAFFQLSSFAQVADWVHKIGGIGSDHVNSIVTDSNGDVIVAGWFSNTVDFDPSVSSVTSLTTNGNLDAYIAKYTSLGDLLWVKRFGNATNDYVRGLALDANNNIFATGYFQGTISFNEPTNTITYTANGSYNSGFLVKLNSSGTTLWANKIGGTFENVLSAVTVNSVGEAYVTGYQEQSSTANGASKIIFAKYNADGTNAFYHQLNGNWQGWGKAITVDNNDNVYLAGRFSNTVNFNPTGSASLTVTGNFDGFVAKYAADGTYAWAKKIGGGGPDVVNAIKTHTNGDVYITGGFTNTANFGAGFDYTAVGGYDVFVAKLNSAGTTQWVKNFGNGYDDTSYDLELDNDGNVYFTGDFSSVATEAYDVNPDVIAVKDIAEGWNYGAYILKYTAAGNYAWVRTIYNDGTYIRPHALSVVSSNTMYWGGDFFYTTNFNFDFPSTLNARTSSGAQEGYLMKLGPCTPTTNTITASSCVSYTLNAQTYTATGVYTQTLTNYLECDSIITLNLTIKPTSTSTITTYICSNQSYAFGTPPIVALYSFPGTYTLHATNYLGCDSIITLNLFVKPISTSTLTTTSCANLVVNAQTYTYTGVYQQTLTNYLGCDSILTINFNSLKSYYYPEVYACTSYTLNGQTYTTSDFYIQTLTNYLGCDSIIGLDLYIQNPIDINNTVTLTGNSLTSNYNGSTVLEMVPNYQWIDCDNGNSAIAGASGVSFAPTTGGNYAVKITEVCTVTTACTNFIDVGLANNFNEKLITLTPNPATESFEINNIQAGTKIAVYSVDGKLAIETVSQQNHLKINSSNFNSGVYFVHIQNSDQLITKKLIVTNR